MPIDETILSVLQLPDDLARIVATFVGVPEPEPEPLEIVPEWQDGVYGMLPQPSCCVKTV